MTRGIVAALPFAMVVAGGCQTSYVGMPCVPSEEYDEAFLGYDPFEIKIDTTSDPDVVCLVFHFRGRTTCPYGQNTTATALPTIDGASGGPFPSGGGPCLTPKGAPVTGDPLGDPIDLAQVPPQCPDRRPDNTVFFSCKCANAVGQTDDGARYCSCANGTTCQQLVVSPAVDFGSGAYCMPKANVFDPSTSCYGACDPNVTTCT